MNDPFKTPNKVKVVLSNIKNWIAESLGALLRPSIAIDITGLAGDPKRIRWDRVIAVYHRSGVIIYDSSKGNAPTCLGGGLLWFGRVKFVDASKEEIDSAIEIYNDEP